MPLQTLAIAAAALVAWTAQGQAAAITSTTSLIEGDLTFSHFGATVSKGDFGLTSPDMASQINVTKSDNGIEFSSGFMAYGVGAFDDVVLKYEVQTSNGTKISQIGLDFNGSIFGFAIAQVIETVKDQFGHMVGQLTVSCSLLGCDRQDPFLEWGDIPLNIGYTDLYVTKDIYVGAALGSASISTIDQTFCVPEPASLAALGVGLIGLGFTRRRRTPTRQNSAAAQTSTSSTVRACSWMN